MTTVCRLKWWSCLMMACVVTPAILPLTADDRARKELSDLVQGNERFGRVLLANVHSQVPQKNVVVCPISIALTFAAIQHSSRDTETRAEIGSAFGWGPDAQLAAPAKTLLSDFQKVDQSPAAYIPYRGPGARFFGVSSSLEEISIKNIVLFPNRNPGSTRDIRVFAQGFVDASKKYFGMSFYPLGAARPTEEDLRRVRPSTGQLPPVSPRDDIWISSGVRLRSRWIGNMFYMTPPFRGEFRTAGGESRKVEMRTSELSSYPHAITDSFEAVVLQCNTAYLIAVLPAPGKDIHELEKELAENPDTLDASLKPEIGMVTIPKFHISSDRDIRPMIQEMGIRKVFRNLVSIVQIPYSRLTEVAQRTDIIIDWTGIHADAETIFGGIIGGISRTKEEPFRMRIDRPFLFLVRDNTANSLLFMGAVMDPSRQ